MEKDFFRRIENTIEVRKNILESSKEVIKNLKGYQRILGLRKEKLTAEKELKLQLKEINLLLDKLRDTFPADLINQFEAEKPEEQKTVVKKEGKKTEKRKVTKKKARPSELAKLENSLAEIENKLNRLA